MIQGETYYAKFQTTPSASLVGFTGAYKLIDSNSTVVLSGSMTLGADYFTLQFSTASVPVGAYTLYCLVTFPDLFVQAIHEEMIEVR